MCIMLRRLAFWQVKSSMADTSKIQDPTDIWQLPWDKEDNSEDLDEEEYNEMQSLIDDYNRQNAKSDG